MKRKIATLLAATMVLGSTFNAFADAVSTPDITTELPGASVSGTGNAEALATEAYKVVVSTNAKLDYVADPQGLLNMSGDSASFDDLKSLAGDVYADSKLSILNKSSKDIVAEVTVTATAASGSSDTNVALVADSSGLTGSAPKMLLGLFASEATFETVEADEEAADGAIKYVATVADQSTTGYALKDGVAVKVPVALKASGYEITRSGTEGNYSYSFDAVEDELGGAVQFAIAGKCSGDGWTDGTNDAKLPGISVAYSFRDVDTESTDQNLDLEGKNIVIDSESTLSADVAVDKVFAAETKVVSFGEDNVVTGTLGQSIEIAINDVDGDNAFASLKDLTVILTGNVTKTVFENGTTLNNPQGSPYVIVTGGKIYVSSATSTYMLYDENITIVYKTVGGAEKTVEVMFTQAS